ncbi:hypothetical protein TNCV_4611881 [Trichonephila clavipes]|nr:hypothetical protein TNCV_4611881 [Trichonephila clavipes]
MTTNHHRTGIRKAHLVDENHDNSSCQEDDVPDEGDDQTSTGIWSFMVELKKPARMKIFNLSRGDKSGEQKYGTTKAVTGNQLYLVLPILMPYNYCYFLNWKKMNQIFYLIWQQDGAPNHWHLSISDWLKITVPNQWISRKEHPGKGFTALPPR